MGVYVKDIKMPANCCECIFESIDGNMADYYWYCCAVKDRPVIDDDIRRTACMKWCPLMNKTEV